MKPTKNMLNRRFEECACFDVLTQEEAFSTSDDPVRAALEMGFIVPIVEQPSFGDPSQWKLTPVGQEIAEAEQADRVKLQARAERKARKVARNR